MSKRMLQHDKPLVRLPLTLFILLLLAAALPGCATNPVTGKTELSLLSEDWELKVGEQQYAPSVQAQGGEYVVDPQIQEYVSQVGQRLSAVADRQLPYEFEVINSGVPNAWALPGGKIAINRGLLTELQSEAELAAVLGHEIVHAAARHGAQGMQRGMLLQGGVIAATIASQGGAYSNLAQLGASVGAQLINTKYGRDAERESDYYGIQYMQRAGYDPQGAVDLQRTFVKLSEGRRQDFLSGLFASHPPSQERVEANVAQIAELPKGGEVGRERYQQAMATLVKTAPAYTAYDEARQALGKGDTGQAQTLVQKAISIEPREGHFHSLLGDVQLKQKRYRDALGHYDKAIQLNDNFFYYHLQRGLVSEQLNQSADARRHLERSLKLLPTANALYALGNVERAAGQLDKAKAYYAQAAGQDSEVGKAALGSLVELDLSNNPGEYLQTRHGIDANGNVQVEIANPTPKDVEGVVVAVVYPDAAGRAQQVNRQLSGRLPAGQRLVIDVSLQIDPQLAGSLKTGVVQARLAN